MCCVQAYILRTVSSSTVELSDLTPNDVSKHQASVEENYAQQEEDRFLPAQTQTLQTCATPFNAHRILDLTSGSGFTDIDPPPPINACLCRKEFRLHIMFGEQRRRIRMGKAPHFVTADANRNLESRYRCCLYESRVSSSRRVFSWDDMSSVMEVWAPNHSSLR